MHELFQKIQVYHYAQHQSGAAFRKRAERASIGGRNIENKKYIVRKKGDKWGQMAD